VCNAALRLRLRRSLLRGPAALSSRGLTALCSAAPPPSLRAPPAALPTRPSRSRAAPPQPSRPAEAEPPGSHRAAQQQPSRPAAAGSPWSRRAAQEQPSRLGAAGPPRSRRAAQKQPSRPGAAEPPSDRRAARPALPVSSLLTLKVEPLTLRSGSTTCSCFLQCDRADSLSLFDLTSGASPAPATDADPTVRSQWATRDAAARLAVRRHLPTSERAHFSQYKSAQTLYDAVVARYSSPATAALSRLALPFLFPDLTAFHTVADLITHLRTIDTRYRAALPADFCAKKPPPCTSLSTS
ncbi:unnamed protein product, partial [Closterium sp. NIES-54]